MTTQELQKEMERLMEAGDKNAVESLVLEHFAELPGRVQGAALMQFVSEALESEAADMNIAHLRKVGLSALAELKAVQEGLKDGER